MRKLASKHKYIQANVQTETHYITNKQTCPHNTSTRACMHAYRAAVFPSSMHRFVCLSLSLLLLAPPPPLSRYRYQNNYLMSSLARRPVIRRWVHSRRSLAGRSVVRRWSPSIGRRRSRSTRPTIARRRPRAASTSIPGRRSLAWASSPASWALLGVC